MSQKLGNSRIRDFGTRSRQGVALVIALAFIVLLTGLMVAFFSRAMGERQVSNSSASLARTSVFAEGMTDVLISNLKQEIALSSTVATGTGGSIVTQIYIPRSGTDGNMLPQRSGLTVPTISSWSPNLLIRSGSGSVNQCFFISSSGSIPSGAIAVSSTTPSLNGRYVSVARWNKHCLLTGTGANMVPASTGSNAFIAPDWVLVTRSGSSPVQSDLTSPQNLKWSGTNPSTVVGRYAYAIYHEGGLLDVNAAGYPIGSGSTALVPQAAYKPALAFADLTQIGLNQAQSDQLVAWRNWASAAVSGSSSATPSFSMSSGSNYFNAVVGNGSGFLKSSGTGLNHNQSDKMFASRQELIAFAQNQLGLSGTGLNVLNYLATFTRDINQPSYSPPSNRPLVLSGTSGGNNAFGYDNDINPSLLTARVSKNFTRNDGTAAVVGEPLVKKRFALSRLAWLTCKGPSGPSTANPGGRDLTDADMKALINAGYSAEFLQQGTDANILKYFGLKFVTTATGSNQGNFWQYVHGRDGATGAIMRLNSPNDTNDVARTGRDADFFELLKATINVGSIAKVGCSVPDPGGTTIQSLSNQYYLDSSVDNQIIQIGANIIDQFDSDSFPTRILFNDGKNPATMFAGIENLPYLNRVHPATVKVVSPKVDNDANGTSGVYYDLGTSDTLGGNHTILETGLGATVLIPELWNPHDWCGDSPATAQFDQTMGTMGPNGSGGFQIYAETSVPFTLVAGNSWNAERDDYLLAKPTLSPGYTTKHSTFTFGGSQWGPLTKKNTTMMFTLPRDATGAQLFREPTVLYRRNFPTGSELFAPGLSFAPGAVSTGSELMPAAVGQDGTPATSGSAYSPGPPVIGRNYIGMYIGTLPLIWRKDNLPAVLPSQVWRTKYVSLMNGANGIDVTFTLQCQDAFGNMVTYDQKTVTLGEDKNTLRAITAPMNATWSGFLQPVFKGDRSCFVLDPRTSRFGVQSTGIDQNDNTTGAAQWGFSPFSFTHLVQNIAKKTVPFEVTWLSRDQGIMGSIRNGWGSGQAVQAICPKDALHLGLTPYNFPASMGFYPGNPGDNTVWTWGNANLACRPGLFAENDAAPRYNDQVYGDVQYYYGNSSLGAGYTTGQYYADPDGVVRRGMGGWTDGRTHFIGPTSGDAAFGNPTFDSAFGDNSLPNKDGYAALSGLPMRVAHQIGTDNKLHKTDVGQNYPPSGPTAPFIQAEARPMILNRPFHSVAELGYTFSGTPWKNLNFEMPESGDAALLDVFCVNDTDDPGALVAGKVNLNTTQLPVLKAIINGAYKNEWPLSSGSAYSALTAAIVSGTLADIQANRLVAWTTGIVPDGVIMSSGTGPMTIPSNPMQYVSELVGKWVSGKAPGQPPTGGAAAPTVTSPPYGPTSYDGFSAYLVNPGYFMDWKKNTPNSDANDDPSFPSAVVLDKAISRRRNAPIRALANAGQTRVWNLLIDLVAQTGRYPQSAAGLDKFMVEGEQHYWVHVAIDRFTGQVLDKQIEMVKE